MTSGQREKERRKEAREVIEARKKRRKALIEHLLKSV